MKSYKIFAEILEGSAHAQFMEAMKQPFVVKGALMPDAHKGYSLPIGAVVAAENYVVPAWVGYDIGCGMSAIKLSGVTVDDIKNTADAIFKRIYELVPVGFVKRKRGMSLPKSVMNLDRTSVGENLIALGEMQIGTLGGGNHFIEIGIDEQDAVWITIHSGSRGVGHKLATHYMKLASVDIEKLSKEFDDSHTAMLKFNPTKYEIAKKSYIEKRQLKARPQEGHFGFDADSEMGKAYIKDALFAQEFALENRKEMIVQVIKAILDCGHIKIKYNMADLINRNHNHVVQREIDGKNCYVHRKGATHAEVGMLGVIPGNMRDGSFIVKGKGNPDSLYSSSHGAGRVLGRKAAKAALDVKVFEKQMEGITGKVGESTLDESPDAYKNIFEVMAAQTDLVEVIAHIKPLINIKG